YARAKQIGFLDRTISELSGCEIPADIARLPVYKTVDTCAAEFDAETPYYYSSWDEETEVKPDNGKKKVLVLGSGPIRIGQGIEFDYCSVHAVWALKERGCETVIINNNPETVSTDFDTADRLYFEPLTPEDVTGVVRAEKPDAAIVQFGGQTAINLAAHIEKLGIPILGTPAWSIDAAEDREKFDVILEKCEIPRPAGHTVMTEDEAVTVADGLGYPVLVRPSYVLGGQGMEIAYKEEDVREFMRVITRNKVENPVLVDKYMMGREIEVDAICDGTDILIPGIMEHLERAGVHSGDSISVYPSITIEDRHKETIVRYTEALAKNLAVLGLVNIQFVLYNDEVYVIEVNPRSSRTVPYISKVTGVPMVDLATRCMFGEKLADMGYGTGLYPESDHYAVKVPVFSFQKLRDLDTQLGPEMKSTGEVLGVSTSFREALLKGLIGAGFAMKRRGAVLISVRDSDKQEAIKIAERFERLGFEIYATSGTANVLNRHMIATNAVRNVDEEAPNIIDLIESGKIDYVIATSVKGRHPELGSVHIRRTTVERAIPCLTSIDTASALLRCLEGDVKIENCEMVDINTI
ncbi:MAG: carbamoyl-phosphate synthase large subunit, partial [Clostridia bacterium]|nr:carbamoyl-phosphate synthase large subunit [Clostridia bacterium]